MKSIKLQDTKSTHKNHLHLYTLTINYLRKEIKKTILFTIALKITLRNKFNQGSEKSLHWNYKMKEIEEYKNKLGLPWWHSGWESACQCREHGFEPWSGKIPHAVEKLGPWATIAEPACLEPVLRSGRGRDNERPAHRDEEWPHLPQLERKPSHRDEDPTQP